MNENSVKPRLITNVGIECFKYGTELENFKMNAGLAEAQIESIRIDATNGMHQWDIKRRA
jgi:hypothetical protein